MRNLDEIMDLCPVIPVIVIDRAEDAVPLATALYNGGLKVLEITLRTEFGLAAISAIRKALPEAVVGAGTVVTAEDVRNAKAAGAEFLVSPGCTLTLLAAARAEGIPLLPGVNSPSEAMLLLEQGQRHLKFFPAEAAGGVPMLKSILGPLPQLRFCPTGGINPDNAMEYLSLANVACVGGTWMLDKAAIAAGDWAEIERLSRMAAGLAA
ncbi:2-dehydro-3-deoxyphosphogluconate aldolase [gamma proteobacterium BDW918]|jgi:2-dehydro-3-deoxyphosphogluconate aldolase/(4S)-4-hydroxy-2-oxoglutarate aldolase|uniref:2-dehydro-3-deoxy-phosphogluconate aldolase n=1 Tax=Zhongshania aliphaticivorans TaxID=1470434 RepID=A0A127M7H4_9GAMM|nr:bifunctional 4-hydroxy-2-oxoglutarate aldolase/2-dehydro-3-deoxy-phosphogluconate aldolase [Zhongshania aliphaticivorans]AMO69170.1 keto-deoxy-phosphogluconate aldolase [Zhongshania aliphaticivorans]EIF43782.1 2-dehydro-3-deoxyphosphogluconate aldolase [gamma proteobacterium BDW918]